MEVLLLILILIKLNESDEQLSSNTLGNLRPKA